VRWAGRRALTHKQIIVKALLFERLNVELAPAIFCHHIARSSSVCDVVALVKQTNQRTAIKMGIFDDEARKMAVETAKQLRDADLRKAESNQVAGRVAEDLLKYIAGEPGAEDFDVGVDERRITVRGRSSGRELRIDVSGSDLGAIFEMNGDSGAAIAVDQSQMARRVIEWLQQPCAVA
jgi:hypothetical protein